MKLLIQVCLWLASACKLAGWPSQTATKKPIPISCRSFTYASQASWRMPQCKQGRLKLERRETGLDVFLFYMKKIGKAYSKPALGNQGSENSGQEAFDELRKILIPPRGPSHWMGQESWCENDRPAEKHLIQMGGLLMGC